MATTYGSNTYGAGLYGDSAGATGGAPTVTVECAFGNSIVDDPAAMVWYDLGQTRSFHIKRGKQTRTGRYEAGIGSAVIDNRNRFLDSLNVASPYYSRRIHTPGADTAYISASPGAVTYSDFVVQVRASSANWHTGTKRTLAGQRDTTHGWWFGFSTAGELQIEVYVGGSFLTYKTTGIDVDNFLSNGTPYWFAVHWDPNIAGTGRGAEFYISADTSPVSRDLGGAVNLTPINYRQVGLHHTNTGTGTITSPTTAVRLGSDPGFAGASFNGYIHGVRIDNNVDMSVAGGYGWTSGARIVNANFSFGPTTGAASLVDVNGLTWTLAGTAAIEDDTVFGSYVRPLRPWRIRARDNTTGVTWTLFTGVVEKWPNTWPILAGAGKGDAIATIEGSDAFKVLGLGHLVSYDQIVSNTFPEGWWHFDDPSEGFAEFSRPQGFLSDSGEQDHPLWWRGAPGASIASIKPPLTGAAVSIKLDEPSLMPTTSRVCAKAGIQPNLDQPVLIQFQGGGGGVVLETSLAAEFPQSDAIIGFDYGNNGPRTDVVRNWLPQGNGEFAFAGWIMPDLRGVASVATSQPPNIPHSHPQGTLFWLPWAAPNQGGGNAYNGTTGAAGRIWIYVDHDTGQLKFLVRDGTGGQAGVAAQPNQTVCINAASLTLLAPGFNTGHPGVATAPIFFVCQRRSDGTGEIWINGVLDAENLTATPAAQMATTGMYIGDVFSSGEFQVSGDYSHYMGWMQDFAFWPHRKLQTDEIADMYRYAKFTTGPTVFPTTRVNGILNSYGWPGSARDYRAGDPNAVLGKAHVTAHDFKDDVLTSLHKFADAEDAEFFMGASNDVKWYQRTYLRDPSLALKMTLGDQSTEIRYADLEFLSEDAQIINQGTVQRVGATSVERIARDVGSVKEFGIHTFGKTVPLASSSEAQSLAEEFVRRNSKPLTRINTVTCKPATNGTVMWPLFLSLDLLDRVRVLRTPPGGGARLDVMAYVIGIEITATAQAPADWTFKLVLMNADPYRNVWVLGTSTLGSTTILPY